MEVTTYPADSKRSASLFSALERRAVALLLPRVPRWIEPDHLTLLTLLWSGCALAASALAVRQRGWLWVSSASIVVQYVTDAIDGKLGADRDAGLVRWGYYMDHLLDYVFLCSILLGYALLVPPRFQWMMMVVLAIAGGFMASSFLACRVSGTLDISYLKIGPIEIRILFVGINTWLATIGRASLYAVLPVVILASLAALFALAYRTQRRLRAADAQERSNRQSPIGNRQSPFANPIRPIR